jgi:hypothetical protein
MARRYWAQAVLVTYETFHLATGQDVKLPTPDRGDGMHWSRWATGRGVIQTYAAVESFRRTLDTIILYGESLLALVTMKHTERRLNGSAVCGQVPRAR